MEAIVDSGYLSPLSNNNSPSVSIQPESFPTSARSKKTTREHQDSNSQTARRIG